MVDSEFPRAWTCRGGMGRRRWWRCGFRTVASPFGACVIADPQTAVKGIALNCFSVAPIQHRYELPQVLALLGSKAAQDVT
jgi:hypothetical protein